ncbi:MAG: family 10 glycosylhydrolase [Verrucomicrobia bacterium]|nr:family 10 glycosylhydrolase [Verrucomicrobiota bacterium]
MRRHDVVAALLIGGGLCLPAFAGNWIQNGDFESDQPPQWSGATVEHEVVHAGKGSLRLEEPAGKNSVSARHQPIEVNQKEPEMIMASFWMRFDARRQTGPIRGGVTFVAEMADGTSMAWYGPFELNASEMGSWVYREHRWKPKAPVTRIRPAVYLRGCEGAICVDDLYLGPPVDAPSPPRATIPLAVTGGSGRFTDWAKVAFGSLRPSAHVFHLSGTNATNLELACDVNVKKTAPAYLTSAWGSNYWTLYSPERRELAQIFTDERIDLSKPGPQTVRVRMNGFANRASDLAASGYVFITDGAKNFLIYDPRKPAGERYKDSTTGQTFTHWDTIKIELLSRVLGPTGVTAPFSLADLRSYRFAVTARRDGNIVKVRPTLADAQNNVVPLYGLDLRAEAAGKRMALVAEVADDGVPTGDYLGQMPTDTNGSLKVFGKVRLATPAGIREELIEESVSLAAATASAAKPSLPPLDLLGWGYTSYELSTKASHGPQSMRLLVADAKAAGVTKLLIHARTSRETLYPSRIAAPATVAECDLLALATAEGKKQGVNIYAAYVLGIAQPDDLKAHPDWAMIGRNGKPGDWYCYNNPDVRAFHASLLAEIVTRYDVAGVAVDFVRPDSGCFCPRCAKGFDAKFHKPLGSAGNYDSDWLAWQRDSITDYVRELRTALRKARPDAQLAGYVWARFAPDKDRAGQDWPRWLKENLMDFVAIGQYTPSTPWFRAECHTVRMIAERELMGRTDRVCPLLGVGYIHQANPSHAAAATVIGRHLQAAREEGMRAAGFFAFYDIRPHTETAHAHSASLPQGVPRELIRDSRFQRGFTLLDPTPGRKIHRGALIPHDAAGKPVWEMAQWSSKYPLAGGAPQRLDGGGLRWANEAKAVTLGPVSNASADLTLAVNASAEYGTRARRQGEPWVHLLVDQPFNDPPALAGLLEARLHAEGRLLRSTCVRTDDYTPGLHAAQFQIFFTVQNLNRQSKGYGRYLWFGVPIYDDRRRVPNAHKSQDTGGTGMFIFTPGGKTFTGQSAHDGAWITIDCDLLPLMREALETAWQRGFLIESKDLADYRISGMNIGWEVPGIFDVEMQIRNLSLKVCPRQ